MAHSHPMKMFLMPWSSRYIQTQALKIGILIISFCGFKAKTLKLSLGFRPVGIGMIAISMITFIGAKIFCGNEEPVEVVEEPIEEVVLPRGLFSQVIEKTMSFFGH